MTTTYKIEFKFGEFWVAEIESTEHGKNISYVYTTDHFEQALRKMAELMAPNQTIVVAHTE